MKKLLLLTIFFLCLSNLYSIDIIDKIGIFPGQIQFLNNSELLISNTNYMTIADIDADTLNQSLYSKLPVMTSFRQIQSFFSNDDNSLRCIREFDIFSKQYQIHVYNEDWESIATFTPKNDAFFCYINESKKRIYYRGYTTHSKFYTFDYETKKTDSLLVNALDNLFLSPQAGYYAVHETAANIVHIFETASNKESFSILNCKANDNNSLFFSPDESLITYSQDSSIYIHSVISGELVNKLSINEDSSYGLLPKFIYFSNNNRYITYLQSVKAGINDDWIYNQIVKEVETGEILLQIPFVDFTITENAAFSPDESRFAVIKNEITKEILVYDLDSQKLLRQYDAAEAALSVKFDKPANMLYVNCGGQHSLSTVETWDVHTGRLADRKDKKYYRGTGYKNEGIIYDLTYINPDDNTLLMAYGNKLIAKGIKNNQIISMSKEYESPISEMLPLKKGNRIICGFEDRSVRVLKSNELEIDFTFPNIVAGNFVQVSDDFETLITKSDSIYYFYDIATGEKKFSQKFYNKVLDFSPDGALAICKAHPTNYIFDSKTGNIIFEFDHYYHHSFFSVDGSKIYNLDRKYLDASTFEYQRLTFSSSNYKLTDSADVEGIYDINIELKKIVHPDDLILFGTHHGSEPEEYNSKIVSLKTAKIIHEMPFTYRVDYPYAIINSGSKHTGYVNLSESDSVIDFQFIGKDLVLSDYSLSGIDYMLTELYSWLVISDYNCNPLGSIPGHWEKNTKEYCPNKNLLALNLGGAKVFSIPNGALVKDLPGYNVFEFSRDGQKVLAVDLNLNKVKIMSTENWVPRSTLNIDKEYSNNREKYAISCSGKMVSRIVSDNDFDNHDKLEIYNAETGQIINTIYYPRSHMMKSAYFLPNSSVLAIKCPYTEYFHNPLSGKLLDSTTITITLNSGIYPSSTGDTLIYAAHNGTTIIHTGFSKYGNFEDLVSVDEESVGQSFKMQIYPNPTLSLATASFDIQTPGSINLGIFDQLGKKIKTICDDKMLNPGKHSFVFDLEDEAGGAYYLVLKADGKTQSQLIIKE